MRLTPSGTGTRIDYTIGSTASFPLVKAYGAGFAPYRRRIAKPVAGSVRVAVAGREIEAGAFACDPTTGLVAFAAGHVPPAGAAVTAGFAFDVPVRFDTDELTLDLAAFTAGEIPKVPLVEIVP